MTTSGYNNLNQLIGQNPGGQMEFSGTLNEPGTLTLAGHPAAMDAANNWRGQATVTVGANAIPLIATDVNGNATTKTINVSVTGGSARTLTYDLDGAMVNDGAGKTYAFDAVNRLARINQGGNVTDFAYNGLGQRVQEKFNGTLIKQWVWCGGAQACEERDASNNVTKRFFAQGEQIGATNYYYDTDHLGSVREMIDSSGVVRSRYDFDPYGRITKVSGDLESDFGFTGFYRHQASGLNLTIYRAYDADQGRWLSRDPIGEDGGMNLYAYIDNNPLNGVDATGLISSLQVADPALLGEFGLGPAAAAPSANAAAAGAAATGAAVTGAVAATGALGGQTSSKASAPAVPATSCSNPPKKCPPCTPPVGTIGYRYDTTHSHYPFPGAHVHLYIRRQKPYPDCECVWNKFAVKAPPPPPGAIPMP